MPSLKQKILKNLQNTYCRLKKSKIEGVGVFALREIPKNTELFVSSLTQKSAKFTATELKKIPREVWQMIESFLVLEKDGAVEIPEGGFEGLDMSFYLNHSKTPNVKITSGGEAFVTLRKIKKGEELTINYQKFDNIKKDNQFFI